MAHPPPSTGPHATTTPLALVAPGAFVLIWSTGFLVGRGVAPHADPFWFLSARFACVALAIRATARLQFFAHINFLADTPGDVTSLAGLPLKSRASGT